MEGITQIEEDEAVAEEWFEEKIQQLLESIRYSWLIDTSPPVTVRARFYKPEGSEPDFIKERSVVQPPARGSCCKGNGGRSWRKMSSRLCTNSS